MATDLSTLDHDRNYDVYVKHLATGGVVFASASRTGAKANVGGEFPSLSSSGRYVAFQSQSTNLAPADRNRRSDIYVKDLLTGRIALVSTSTILEALSGDGPTVAFTSRATDLDPGDTDPGADVYVKAVDTGSIRLASMSRFGGPSNGDSSAAALSADGLVVAFQSAATNLDPADRNRSIDVYAVDLRSGELRVVSSSDDGVIGNAGSGNPALSADGQQAAFDSAATSFDPADSGRFDYDIYLKSLCPGTA